MSVKVDIQRTKQLGFLSCLDLKFNDPSLSHKSCNVVHSASYYKASVCVGGGGYSFNAVMSTKSC